MAITDNKTADPTPVTPINGFFGGATEALKTVYNFGAAAQEKADMLASEIKEINGRYFFWNGHYGRWDELRIPLPDDEPVPEPIKLFTLDGLIDYIKENVEQLIPTNGDRLILQVYDETHVCLLGKPSAINKKRPVIAFCEAIVPQIVYGRYMSVDEFNTILLSRFVGTPEREELFKVIKSLTKEQSMNTADDGVSQVITVKQGVSLAANCKFQNPVPLAPMRTFSEIEQPVSCFTLRVDEDARVALFEADGGAWKNTAVTNIKWHLKCLLDETPVVVLA